MAPKRASIKKFVRTVANAMDSSRTTTRQLQSKPTPRPRRPLPEAQGDSELFSQCDSNSSDELPDPPNFPVENDGPNLILGQTQDSLDMDHVLNWLIQAERGEKFGDKIIRDPPVKPQGGQILLYQCRRKRDLDHLRDQYTGFRNTGSTKSKRDQPVLKKYFKWRDLDGNELNFSKDTYERKTSAKKADKIVLIHYMGDHTIFEPRPHGNSKTGKNFTATTKRTLENVLNEVHETGKSSQKIYEKLTKKAAERDDFESRESVVGPRDRKQVENVRQKYEYGRQLLRCEIFSAIEMGRNETLGRFIIRHVVNPYDLIIMAEPAAIRFASSLLQAAVRDPELPQYMSYDTTFNLADAYVSVLVMRNTYIVGENLFPVMYLIHERKLEAVHTEFFEQLANVLDIDPLTSHVPIVLDRERAISNAVRKVIPGAKVVHCSNHIIRDVKFWVRKAGGKQDDITVLKGHVRRMLLCESSQEFDDYCVDVSEMWSQGFKEYFEQELRSDIKNCAAKLYTDQFSAFKGKNATNNASQTFNFMIKNQNEWKELRIDSLIMALFNLQLSLLQDFSRAYKSTGSGRFVLKPQYKNFVCPVEMPIYMAWTESKVLETFKEGIYMPQHNVEKDSKYMQSRSSLAKLTCEQNLVSLDSRAGVFIVTGVYNGKRVIVQRKDPGTLQCSCRSTGYCYHKLAVLYSLQVDISEDKDNYSLSILRRKGRGEKKSGRKTPNVEDSITNVDAAPDSDLARSKPMSEDSEGGEDVNSENNDSDHEDVIITQPQSDDEEALITSEGHRSDNDGSFQAIHHYSKQQFVEPGEDIERPRSSTTGSRSLNFEHETPEFLLLSNFPTEIPKVWTQNSTFGCLEPRQWIAEDIMNDMTRLFIKTMGLKESVAFVNTHEFEEIRTGSLARIVKEALRCQGINSDVLIINIRMNHHFLFAVVLYRTKLIVIVDSKKGHVLVDQICNPLLRLVAATFYVGFIRFDPTEWKIITENEAANQLNGYDCGVFVVFNQYQILRLQPFQKAVPRSEVLRKWILHCLHTTEAKGSILIARDKKIKRLIYQDKARVEHLLSSLDVPDIDSMHETGPTSHQIIKELKICRRGWSPCALEGCKAIFEDNTWIMCTYCRNWYHLGPCVPENEAKDDYYLCSQCEIHRI